MRIIEVGRIDDACQHRRFGKIELSCLLSVVIFGGLFDAADIAGSAEIHLVEIHFEDGFLVGYFFQLTGQINLLHLVFNGAGSGLTGFIVLEIGQLHQLHRKGGSAGEAVAAKDTVANVIECRLGETGKIEAVMFEVAAVFDGQKGINEGFTDLVVGDVFAQLGTDVCDFVAVLIVDMGTFGGEKIIDNKRRFILNHAMKNDHAGRCDDHFETDQDDQDHGP